MDVVLVRHAKPSNVDGICYGSADVQSPSLPKARLAEIATLYPGYKFWSSTLSRCTVIAKKLNSEHSLQIQLDDRIREIDFGLWEGLPWKKIGPVAIDQWIASGYSNVHDGESIKEFDARVASWWNDLDRTQNHFVITHAGVIRSVHRQFQNLSLEESLSLPIDYGQLLSITGA